MKPIRDLQFSRFDVLMVVKMTTVVFWVVTSHSLVGVTNVLEEHKLQALG
jgi:hypothetical protein